MSHLVVVVATKNGSRLEAGVGRIEFGQLNAYMGGLIWQSNERSEYSFIGLADFFFGFFKKVKIYSSSILIFCGLTSDFFFNFSSFPLLKGKQTPLSNSKSVR